MKPQKPRIQVTPAEVTAMVEKAIPLDGTETSLIWHPATQSVYVIGRHPLHIDRTIIRVPVSQWIATAAGMMMQQVVPMLMQNEEAAAKGVPGTTAPGEATH